MSGQTFKSQMNNKNKNKQNKQTKDRLQKVCCWINRKRNGQFNTSSFLHFPEEAIPLDCPVISKTDWKSQAWWLMTALPAPGRFLQSLIRLRLPRLPTVCQANLGNSMRTCLKSTQTERWRNSNEQLFLSPKIKANKKEYGWKPKSKDKTKK